MYDLARTEYGGMQHVTHDTENKHHLWDDTYDDCFTTRQDWDGAEQTALRWYICKMVCKRWYF
jgi:hypothetical protein